MKQSKIKNILKIKILKTKSLKNIIKNITIKSIFHNRNVKNKTRILSLFFHKKKDIIHNNICLMTGRRKSINLKLNLSRHSINFLARNIKIQNYSINSW